VGAIEEAFFDFEASSSAINFIKNEQGEVIELQAEFGGRKLTAKRGNKPAATTEQK
jgi:hypothetical protein